MNSKLNIIVVAVFMVSFYSLMSLIFSDHKSKTTDPFILNTRFGTIMWHSSDKNGVFEGNIDGQPHIYCYYPTKDAIHRSKGEYILKRVNALSDCKDWLGTVIIKEDPWVSENEKLNLKG